MTDLTPTRQRTERGEGLAVGSLVVGLAAVTGDEGALEAAFSPGFASWPWATRYRSLLRAQRPVLAGTLRASEGRRTLKVAQWVASRGLFVPQLRDEEWDLPAACRTIEEATGVPARRWRELAAAFVDGLDASLVWRHPPPGLADGSGGTLDL